MVALANSYSQGTSVGARVFGGGELWGLGILAAQNEQESTSVFSALLRSSWGTPMIPSGDNVIWIGRKALDGRL